MAPGAGGGRGETERQGRRTGARSRGHCAERGERWPGRNGPKDLDAPRRKTRGDGTLRYVVAGATEKGAAVECLTAQVLHRAGAGRADTDEEVRRSRRRGEFAKSWWT